MNGETATCSMPRYLTNSANKVTNVYELARFNKAVKVVDLNQLIMLYSFVLGACECTPRLIVCGIICNCDYRTFSHRVLCW